MTDSTDRLASVEWRYDETPNWEQERQVQVVCWLLNRSKGWEDSEGYEHEILAGAFHPVQGEIGWVECRQKWQADDWLDIEFRLKVQRDGTLLLDWVVPTYNPFFGCDVGYLAWHGSSLVLIYNEKHHTYVASLGFREAARVVRAADRWRVHSGTMEYCPWQSEEVERLQLPELTPLPTLTGPQAQQTGLTDS